MFALRTKNKNEPISEKQCIWVHGVPSDIGLISVSVRRGEHKVRPYFGFGR